MRVIYFADFYPLILSNLLVNATITLEKNYIGDDKHRKCKLGITSKILIKNCTFPLLCLSLLSFFGGCFTLDRSGGKLASLLSS